MLETLIYSSSLSIIGKVKNRILRQFSQLEIIDRYARKRYYARKKQHRERLPKISTFEREIVAQLEETGVCVTHLNELNCHNTKQFWDSCSSIMSTLINTIPTEKDRYFIKATGKHITEYPDLFLWGLNESLLKIVENYLSLPVAYHSVYVRRDLANNRIERSRLWHIDKEDRKMLKIIIYFNDVSDRNGAFQYIPKKISSAISQQHRYNYQYINDSKMNSLLSAANWVSCPGKAGTVIFTDTANTFHRGLLPQDAERLSVFFDYTSAVPWRSYYCKSIFSPQELRTFEPLLSPRQKECVFWR